MKEFRSIAAFVKFAETKLLEDLQAAEFSGVARGAEIIEAEAKHSIGREQNSDSGPFPAWAPLSDATMDGFWHPKAGWIEGKRDLGYTGHVSETDPLLRDGFLRDSYTHVSVGYTAVVGSDDLVALWQEHGTPNARYPIPPRSILAGAAVRTAPIVIEQMGGRVVWALRGLGATNY